MKVYLPNQIHVRPLSDQCIKRYLSWRQNQHDDVPERHIEQMRMLQTCAALQVQYRPVIFLGAVFTPAVLAAGEIKLHKDMLKLLAPNPIQQRHVISGFEWFCGSRHPSIMKFFPVILKELYDEEIVDEEVFILWNNSYTRCWNSLDLSMISYEILEQLRFLAAPFITWLQQAEEDDDEDSLIDKQSNIGESSKA
jgi:translation initiation factor 5